MRPLLVVLFALLVIGSLYGYLKIADQPTEASVEKTFADAAGQYRVEITLPFDAAGNVFSDLDDDQLAFVVKLDGKTLRKESGFVPRGIINIENVAGIKIGRNEFLVNAQPKQSSFGNNSFSLDSDQDSTKVAAAVPVALRIRIFCNDLQIGEKTFWAEPGMPIVQTLTVEVEDRWEIE
jgi:hypothetical protein